MKKLHILLMLAAFVAVQADAFFGGRRCRGGRCEDKCYSECRTVEKCDPCDGLVLPDICAPCEENKTSCKVWYKICPDTKTEVVQVPCHKVLRCKEVCEQTCDEVCCDTQLSSEQVHEKYGRYIGKHNALEQECINNNNY